MVSKNIGQVFDIPLHWKPTVVMTPSLSSPRLSVSWQLAGTTVITKLALRQFSILGITHGLGNIRGYDCNTLPLTTIYWKWISFVLPCFIYASSGDKQCVILGESLWTMNQFVMPNESQVCELCVSMFRNKWYWFIQIHLDKPYCAAFEPESIQWCKLEAAPFWHIMAHLRGCNSL